MEIYKYDNYEDYVNAQVEANVRKINNLWVNQETIEAIHKQKPFASFILCHGTRNAAEQKFFKKFYPYAEILGTEISHTATKFEMTIQHDFHEELKNYNDKCDIIYSNSFDHSYDPEKSLNEWIKQLSSSGTLFLEVMLGDENKSKRSDPLSITVDEISRLVTKLGAKVIKTYPSVGGYKKPTEILVIEK